MKPFVNYVHVGNITISDVRVKDSDKREERLTFRCSKNPFKNAVRLPSYYDYKIANWENVEELVAERHAQEQLIPIVIRNALVNYYGVIFMTAEQRAEMQIEHKVRQNAARVENAKMKADPDSYYANAHAEFLARQAAGETTLAN